MYFNSMQHTYLSKVKILVVDDQRFSRVLLRRILGVLGCRRITEANSADLGWNWSDGFATMKPAPTNTCPSSC